jgi:hypothetical protein
MGEQEKAKGAWTWAPTARYHGEPLAVADAREAWA